MQIWDTVSGEVNTAFPFNGTHGAFLVYAVDDP